MISAAVGVAGVVVAAVLVAADAAMIPRRRRHRGAVVRWALDAGATIVEAALLSAALRWALLSAALSLPPVAELLVAGIVGAGAVAWLLHDRGMT